jgi:L-fuconolactonase
VTIEVVDAQVHVNVLCQHTSHLDNDVVLGCVVGTMDAVGVDAVIIDEFAGVDAKGHMLPGHLGPEGVWRSDHRFADYCVSQIPDRFAYVARIDHRDSDLDSLLDVVAATPNCLAIRIIGLTDGVTWWDDSFLTGDYAHLLAAAQARQIPVFVHIPGRIEALVPYIEQFPDLQLIVDHMGIGFPSEKEDDVTRYGRLDPVLEMAKYDNLALKWCHIERLAVNPYPFTDVMPHVRRILDAFGSHRVMWASDATQSRRPELSPHPSSWGQCLAYLAGSDMLSTAEKVQVLGQTARRILRWPAL